MGLFGGSSSSTLSTTKNYNSSGSGDLSGDQASGTYRLLTGGDSQFSIVNNNASATELIDLFGTLLEGNQNLYKTVQEAQSEGYAATTGALASAYQAQAGDTLGRLNTTLGGVGNIVKTAAPFLLVGGLALLAYFIFGRKK